MVALNPWPSPEGYQFYLESVSPFSFRDQFATHLKEYQNEITLTLTSIKHVICVENIFHSKI